MIDAMQGIQSGYARRRDRGGKQIKPRNKVLHRELKNHDARLADDERFS